MNMCDYAYNSIVVFCFIIEGNRLLLIHREQDPYKGTLTVPGGKKERGESISQACIREVREETGFVPCALELAGVVHNYQEGEGHETLTFYFTCHSFSGELRSGEEGRVEWYDIDASFSLKDTNLHYLQIAPFVFARKGKPFEGQIVTLKNGEIIRSTLDYLKDI
ncbi:NUDIX hydrolase [Aminobacterium mobile]|jgi:8-oxo-dGTP diphosphatase|uniref:NUDIX hydrolase n=1 Tax=Aminobacterium mobile TaxID=81467 RepID=UPI000464A67C|nr:NUDIX domain-containing protein [Aminobacterium mobile]